MRKKKPRPSRSRRRKKKEIQKEDVEESSTKSKKAMERRRKDWYPVASEGQREVLTKTDRRPLYSFHRKTLISYSKTALAFPDSSTQTHTQTHTELNKAFYKPARIQCNSVIQFYLSFTNVSSVGINSIRSLFSS